MPKPATLWKATIEIFTEYDPSTVELEDLAREATSGSAIAGMTYVEVPFADVADEVGDFFGEDECEVCEHPASEVGPLSSNEQHALICPDCIAEAG